MLFNNNEKYIKKHLIDYIIFQLNQGYEFNDIKTILINYGYSSSLINEIKNEIDFKNLNIKKNKNTSKTKLSKEIKLYLEELITDFILKELEQGYSISAIKKALINYGHDKYLIDDIVLKMNNSKQNKKNLITAKDLLDTSNLKSNFKKTFKKEKKFKFKLPLLLNYFFSIIAILFIIFFLVIKTNTEIFIVFLSFLPSILAITFSYFIFLKIKSESSLKIIPVFSALIAIFIFVGLFYLLKDFFVLSNPAILIILNFILSLILSTVICFFSFIENKKNCSIIENNQFSLEDKKIFDDFDREEKKLENLLNNDKFEKIKKI
ncbi:MAG: hypothetical protein ACLFPJ_00455 [Candidatus Woesearchaeota archaeon]